MKNDDPAQNVKVFEDILSLLKHLEAEHEPNIHVYRGQVKRFTHNWVDENGPITLESLYPSDYRFITNYDNPARFLSTDISAARSYGRKVRDMFMNAMTLLAEFGNPDWAWLKDYLEEFNEGLVWLAGQKESGRSLEEIAKDSAKDISLLSTRLVKLFWSLAQHYLIATALIDITFSPRIAAWFATQAWDASKESPTEGKGVIYRFKLPCLEVVLKEQTIRMVEWARKRGDVCPPDLFFVDIRNIPVAFAGRPAGQEGGSVYGFDQPEVLKAIAEKDCQEIFEFYHGNSADALKPLRQVIVPANDPFAGLAERLSLIICDATRVDVRVTSSYGVLLDADATAMFSKLKLDAGLTIETAQLDGRIPLDNEYKGYLFTDITSSGHHGYTALLAVINEKTKGILGYVSLEPLQHPIGSLPGVLFIIASWFNRTRIVVDVAAGPMALTKFPARAVSIAKQAIGKDPNAATRTALGQIIEYYGDPVEALKSLTQDFVNGNLNSGVNLSMLLIGMGLFDEGAEVLKTASALGSDNAAFNLGTIHEQRGNYHDAEIWFNKALEMGDKEANYSLGRLFESQGDWKRAEHYYRLSHEVDNDFRAPNNLGIVLYKLGRYEEARQILIIGVQMGDELAAFNLNTLNWNVL